MATTAAGAGGAPAVTAPAGGSAYFATPSPIDNCIGTAASSDTSLLAYIGAVLAFFGKAGAGTYENVLAMAAWAACEGVSAAQGAFNPFNTTFPGGQTQGTTVKSSAGPVTLPAGNSAFLGNNPQQNNGDPVKNYAGWGSGVAATVATINNTGIKQALGQNNANTVAMAVGAAHWGTNPACITSKISTYRAHPDQLCSALAQPVNIAGQTAKGGAGNVTVGGGAGAGADAGQAVPIGNISVSSLFGPLGTLLADLTSSQFWLRLGVGLLGAVLVIGGTVIFMASTKTGQTVAKAAVLA